MTKEELRELISLGEDRRLSSSGLPVMISAGKWSRLQTRLAGRFLIGVDDKGVIIGADTSKPCKSPDSEHRP